MVAGLDNTRGSVEVSNILVGGCVPEEDASEVVAVEFASAVARAFDAHSGAKCPKVCNVGLPSVPCHI